MYYRLAQYSAKVLSFLGWLLVILATIHLVADSINGIDPAQRLVTDSPLRALIYSYLQAVGIGLATAAFGALVHATIGEKARSR